MNEFNDAGGRELLHSQDASAGGMSLRMPEAENHSLARGGAKTMRARVGISA